MRGTMPRFNHVREEYGIHHEEYEVPAEVFMALEKEEAATRNVTVAAEAKKRKGGGAAKALAKKPRVGVLAEASGSSSGSRSTSIGSGSAEPAGGFVAPAPVVEGGAPARPEPSAANPLPSLLSEDSSDTDALEAEPTAAPAPVTEVQEE